MSYAIVRAGALAVVAIGSHALAQQSTTYAYDALGRLTAVGRSNSEAVIYGYDPAGNRTSILRGVRPLVPFA